MSDQGRYDQPSASGAQPGGPFAEPVYPSAPAWGAPPPPFSPPPGGGAIWAGGQPPPYIPALAPADRARAAVQDRARTDYIFDFWTALGWSLLTFGVYGYYVFYQLVRRMRDHNARRLELLDAALSLAWEEAGRRRLQAELTPSFQRASAHLAVLRKMTSDFRDPAIWLVLSLLAGGIVQIVAFVLLDQDLVKHGRAEAGADQEVAAIYQRLGASLGPPGGSWAKDQHNYLGRIVATFFSFGLYSLWWYHDMMKEPNLHFQSNWAGEDALLSALQGLRQ
jgi:hypothetical protein